MKKRSRRSKDQDAEDPDLERLSSAVGLASLLTFDHETAQALYGGRGPAKPVRVVIEVDSSRAVDARTVTWGSGQTFQSTRDGGLRVAFVCSDFAPVIARVLRFGSHARVKQPASLVAHVVGTLNETRAAYAKASRRK